ncbi:hypothetical protein D3C78_1888210 [compost metagenome]
MSVPDQQDPGLDVGFLSADHPILVLRVVGDHLEVIFVRDLQTLDVLMPAP